MLIISKKPAMDVIDSCIHDRLIEVIDCLPMNGIVTCTTLDAWLARSVLDIGGIPIFSSLFWSLSRSQPVSV